MENTEEIKAGDLYKHFKGDYYKIVCIARDSDSTEQMVVYEGQYISKEWGLKPIWIRSLVDFKSPKKLDDGTEITRFVKVESIPKEYTGLR